MVVVSAVSMCNQNVSVAETAVDGMVTVWYSVFVVAVPKPSSQATQDPECGGSAPPPSKILESFATQGADVVPLSNPAFCMSCDVPPPLLTVTVTAEEVPVPLALVAVAVTVWLPFAAVAVFQE